MTTEIEWGFAKTRQKLIDMVKRFAKQGNADAMAENIVDCCLVSAWEWNEKSKKEALKSFADDLASYDLGGVNDNFIVNRKQWLALRKKYGVMK